MKDRLQRALRRQLFVPFQIVVDETTVYDVRHPELLSVGDETLALMIPLGDPQDGKSQIIAVALAHVSKLLPLGPRPPA